MTPQISSGIEYLIPTYSIVTLHLQSNMAKNPRYANCVKTVTQMFNLLCQSLVKFSFSCISIINWSSTGLRRKKVACPAEIRKNFGHPV